MPGNRRQWQILTNSLYEAADRELESRAAPYLEYLFPGIWGAKRMGEIDAAGIDLRSHTPDGAAIDVVVQCKGFEVPVPGADQVNQIVKSVKSLRDSQYRPRRYILLHNRDLRNRVFREGALDVMAALQKDGIAASAELWNHLDLCNRVAEKLGSEIESTLADYSRALADDYEGAHFLAAETLEPIPLKRGGITFTPALGGNGLKLSQGPPERSNLGDVLAPANDVRWTLISGPFGIGKTKVALVAALRESRRILFVRAADVIFPEGLSGKTAFMKAILRAIGLKTALAELVGPELEEAFSAAELAAILERANSPYALAIDGLDENPLFSDHGFLGNLGNILGELRSQSILLTRREHFDVLIGAFERLMVAGAKAEARGDKTTFRMGRHKSAKPISFIELLPWSTEDAKALLAIAMDKLKAHDEYAERLERLGQIIAGNHQIQELAAHPLFMQMLIDLASADEPLPEGESALIDSWAFGKILRDVQGHQHVVPRGMDPEAYVTRMFSLMSRVARRMDEITTLHGAAVAPVDSLSEMEIEAMAKECFGWEMKIADVVVSSLLVPAGPRKQRVPTPLRLRFFHSRIREHFLQSGSSCSSAHDCI